MNKYDWLLIVLITALAGGEIGGALQISRAIGIISLPIFLGIRKSVCGYIRNQPETFTAVILLWATFSLLWTGNVERGLQELVYFIVHFSIFLEIIVFSALSRNRIRSIAIGWSVAVLITSFIALWEFTTGQHLSYGTFENDIILHTGFVRRFAAATFYNFNDYEVFLCYSSVFILVGIKESTKSKDLVLFFSAILAAIVIVLMNASRGATISITFLVAVGLWSVIRSGSSSNKSLVYLLAGVFLFVIIKYIDIILINLYARADNSSMFESGRTEIWRLAYQCLLNTYLMGTGIAGIESGMSVVSNNYLAVHNLFIEILVEFGIFIFVYTISILYKMYRHIRKSTYSYRKILLATLFILPMIGIVSSKYLLCPDLYAFIASLYILVYNEKYA